jgi:predicted dehydrogenase
MDQQDRTLTRRDFLVTSTTAAIAAGAVLGDGGEAAAAPQTRANARVLGANDRINFAVIGTKGMGGGHLRNLVGPLAEENVSVVAVCDVWQQARERAQATAALSDSAVYTDYRRLLENHDLDAVVIATPDHWHEPMAVDAMNAGKHVYVEKPMTRTLEEAFRVYDVARRTGRLVQVGSQGCSDPKYLSTRELFKSRDLGRLLWAQGSYCRNNPRGEWNYDLDPEATPQTVDWSMWLGPARKRAWSAERYFRWRKYWDYGNGIIGDLWPHRLHPLMLAMNLNAFPRAVSCMGGDLCQTDRGPGPDGQPYGEPRDVADTTLMTAEFPSGVMIFLAGATTNERGLEDVIRTQKVNVLLGGGRLQIAPERPFTDEIDPSDETPPEAGESHAKHMKNFIDSMRANVPPNCDVELGVRVQAVVSMAEESYRKGKTIRFDERRRRMT